MDGIVCDNCSTPLPSGSKYCSTCGTPVPDSGAGARQLRSEFPTDLRQALQLATSDEYEIHHELGRGGMGRVFLAREIALDRLVALKVLPPTLMFDDGLVERFKREARMVAQLHHPNIISIYRVYHSHNLAFYTMHYVPGRTLGQVMRSSPVLPLPEVERTLSESAAGLAYAHKRGVVHRDVKPGNILLDEERHVHLTDFGIAKALSATTQLTDTGAVIGTPQYMAPEQYEGSDVDGRADQYSLAVVGYQLLVGHCPFESESMKQLLYQHLFTPPRPVNTIRPETPMPLRDAIHKALSKDPDDRFETMDDFKAAIEGKGPPIFVSWLDSPAAPTAADGGLGEGGTTTHRLRGVPKVAGAQLPAVIESSNGSQNVETVKKMQPYRRAFVALALTVIVLTATAVLAISQGQGLSGILTPRGATETDLAAGTAGLEADQAGMLDLGSNGHTDTDEGTATANDESTTPAEVATLDGDLPPADGTPANGGADAAGGDADGAASKTTLLAAGGAVTTSPAEPRNSQPASSRPAARRDARPYVSTELLGELHTMMEQGKVLHEMGRYDLAVEAYRDVMTGVSEASPDSYRNGDVLRTLWSEADSAFDAAKLACEVEKQSSCPS